MLVERKQIGLLRDGGADIEPITRDTNGYAALTLSADGRTLATVRRKSYATISVLSQAGHGFGSPRILLSQANEFNRSSDLLWGADGDLLVSDGSRLLKLGTAGGNPIPLLAESNAWINTPATCGPNYIVLSWRGHGGTNSQDIWRTNSDGSSPLRLTDGKFDASPICSPDQKWVYYSNFSDYRIYRVPLDGSGKAQALFELPGYLMWLCALSPGGKTLAATVLGIKQPGLKIALFEIGSSSLPHILDVLHHAGKRTLQFTTGGKSVLFVHRENGVDNVWVQPLSGSAGHPITDFKSEQIWSFRLSPDGKNLAVLRGHFDSDVVLLQETK